MSSVFIKFVRHVHQATSYLTTFHHLRLHSFHHLHSFNHFSPAHNVHHLHHMLTLISFCQCSFKFHHVQAFFLSCFFIVHHVSACFIRCAVAHQCFNIVRRLPHLSSSFTPCSSARVIFSMLFRLSTYFIISSVSDILNTFHHVRSFP